VNLNLNVLLQDINKLNHFTFMQGIEILSVLFSFFRHHMLYWFLWPFTDDHLQLSPYLSYVSGALAGCAATVGSYPFDLLRTILASQGEPKVCVRLLLQWQCF